MQSSYNRDQPYNREQAYTGDRALQRLTNWLAVIVLLALGVVWPPADAAGAADTPEAGREVVVAGPATDDLTSPPHAGTLFLKSSAQSPAIPALRQSTSLSARVTASFGVATLPDDALDVDGLLRLADRALYAAKQRGRNRVEAVSAAGVALDEGTPLPR